MTDLSGWSTEKLRDRLDYYQEQGWSAHVKEVREELNDREELTPDQAELSSSATLVDAESEWRLDQ